MGDPSFLLIGAPKCGTNWLTEMLRQHPQVGMSSRKELHFFDSSHRFEKGLDWYRSQFTDSPETAATGEATAQYLAGGMDRECCVGHEEDSCARLVHRCYPDLRLILMLRNPVDRVVSSYYQRMRRGAVSPRTSLTGYIRACPSKIEVGYYAAHLHRWQALFHPRQMLVLIFEEAVAANRRQTLQAVFRFLEVDPWFVPQDIDTPRNARPSHFGTRVEHFGRRLARAAERCRLPERIVRATDRQASRLRRYAEAHTPSRVTDSTRWDVPVEQSELNELAALYKDPNRRLEGLLGRSLPW